MTRSRKPAARAAAIDELYATLPAIECKGRCYDSCGPIQMTSVERRRIRAGTGVDVKVTGLAVEGGADMMRCSALTVLNRCAVYDLRPAICRLWGLTRAMQCSYGCVPEGGYMTERDGYLFLAAVARAAGEDRQAERFERTAHLPDLEFGVWMVRRGYSPLDIDVRRQRR